MPRVDIKREGSIEKALRKFKRKLKMEGTLEEMKKREFYEKPSQQRRRKKAAAIRREQRRAREEW